MFLCFERKSSFTMLATVAFWCMEAQTALDESKLWLPRVSQAWDTFFSGGKFGVTFFGGTTLHRWSYIIVHRSSIRIFQEKIFGAELTNCHHLLSELHLASKKSKGSPFHHQQAMPGVILKQASSIRVQPHAHGDPSPTGPSPTMGRLKSHAATAWRMEKTTWESGNASVFFFGKMPTRSVAAN